MKLDWKMVLRTGLLVGIGLFCVTLVLATLFGKSGNTILGDSEAVAPKTTEQRSGVQITNPLWDSRFQVLEDCQVLLVKMEEESLRPIFDKLADYEILYTFPTTQPLAEEYLFIIRLKPPGREK